VSTAGITLKTQIEKFEFGLNQFRAIIGVEEDAMAQESPLVIPIFDLVLCLSQAVERIDDLIPLTADNANLTNPVAEPRGKPCGFHIEEGEGVGVESAHLNGILPQNFPTPRNYPS